MGEGGNREKACEIAGVPPEYEEIEFTTEDALRAFVADRNERRNITAGQKAMGHALLFPEPEQGGRGKKTVQPLNSFSKQSLSNARVVHSYSPELARRVCDGTITLGDAYQKVRSEEGQDEARSHWRPDGADWLNLS